MKRLVNTFLASFGILFLLYAILGNYVALPGYVRFLERGSVSTSGNAFDLSVFIGAAKTVIWMYSFQLGVICLALIYALKHRYYPQYILLFSVIWLAIWSWPELPAPGSWFYITFGTIIMLCIALVLLADNKKATGNLQNTLFLGALMFFAFATWEVCGLGATGRMLHPEQAAKPLAHNILVTQSTKLMIEFVIAWSLLLSSFILSKSKPQYV